MSGKLYNKYRVDNVPFYLFPFFLIYGYGLGGLMYLYMIMILSTSKVSYFGMENLDAHKNYIYTFWHEYVIAFFLAKPRPLNFSAINHPLWYMKTVHVAMRSIGVKEICLGSSGNNGIGAAIKLTDLLKKGRSTFINPDGPYGPAYHLKKGVLHIAKDSNVPIVAVNFEFSKSYQMKGWDHKKVPLPFTVIKVVYSKPIIVNEHNFEMATVELINLLKNK